MKKKISDLNIGDIVEIKGKYFDVYDNPSKLENGEYLFAIVNHGDIDKVNSMTYITPMDLTYEISLNFENQEIDVVTEEDIRLHNEAVTRAMTAQLEDDWEDRVSSYSYW